MATSAARIWVSRFLVPASFRTALSRLTLGEGPGRSSLPERPRRGWGWRLAERAGFEPFGPHRWHGPGNSVGRYPLRSLFETALTAKRRFAGVKAFRRITNPRGNGRTNKGATRCGRAWNVQQRGGWRPEAGVEVGSDHRRYEGLVDRAVERTYPK